MGVPEYLYGEPRGSRGRARAACGARACVATKVYAAASRIGASFAPPAAAA